VSGPALRPHQRTAQPVELPFATVWELFRARAAARPDQTFLIAPGEREHTLSYAQLEQAAVRAAGYLAGLGLRKADRVALCLPNSAEFVPLYLGALASGLTVVPINPDLAPDEILFIVANSRSRVLLHFAELDAKLAAIRDRLAPAPALRLARLPSFEPAAGDPEAGARALAEAGTAADDEAVIIYTSGTTGSPKGVVLTHFNFVADAMAISDWFGFSPTTRTLCLLPLFHNNGQVVTLLAPLYGGGSTVIVQGKASPMAFWGLVEKYQVNWTSVMPSILAILLSLPGERKDRSLAGIVCGGQVLTRALQDAFEARFDVPVFEGFGLTETTSFACFNRHPRELRRPGSVGVPLRVNDMAIVDEAGRELPPGQEGEILIRGLNVAKEYFDLPERNAGSFRDGWFHSGDFGYRDAEGHYYFRCRKDNLIIKGGENIYPAELENVLFRHPAVAECAVFGVPDKLLGEDLAAAVKLKPGLQASEAELKAFCSGRIARFKQARRILVADQLDDLREIPKGPTGKVLVRLLQEYYRERFPEP
jgi:acyl-CoA synthetase (AMP-forming)/AMP-acid ligase II